MPPFQTPSPPPLQPQFQAANWYQNQAHFQANWYQSQASPEFVPETQEQPAIEEPEPDEEEENEDDDDTEEEAEESAHRSGKAPRKNWTTLEEEVLARSWCDISAQSDTGNDRTAKHFWKFVWKRFLRELKKSKDYRTQDQVNSKWNKMNKEVQKYNGCYHNLRNQSGENEGDLIDRAADMYRQDTCRKWTFGHVWRIVRQSEKWNHLPPQEEIARRGSRRSKLSTQHLPRSHEAFDVDDDEEIPDPPSAPLPMGRDAAKKKARLSGSSSSRSEEFSELKNQFANLNASITQRNELRAMETYMRDISHLRGEEYETAHKLKDKIRRQFGF